MMKINGRQVGNYAEKLTGEWGEIISQPSLGFGAVDIAGGAFNIDPITGIIKFGGLDVHYGPYLFSGEISSHASIGMIDSGLSSDNYNDYGSAGLRYRSPSNPMAPVGFADFEVTNSVGGMATYGNTCEIGKNSFSSGPFVYKANNNIMLSYDIITQEYRALENNIIANPLLTDMYLMSPSGDSKKGLYMNLDGRLIQYHDNGATAIFYADPSGMYATDFFQTSDRKNKDNIKPIKNGLDVVSELQGVTFDWNTHDKSSSGFIAQEVAQIIPDSVSEAEDGTKKLNYSSIIAYQNEAIKELKDEVQELKELVQQLISKDI